MSARHDIDISRLSLKDLRDLAERVEREIHERREAGRRWLSQHGLVEKQGARYRNPKNSRETWSGRGKQPAWVAQALDEGLSLAQLKSEGTADPDLPARSSAERR